QVNAVQVELILRKRSFFVIHQVYQCFEVVELQAKIVIAKRLQIVQVRIVIYSCAVVREVELYKHETALSKILRQEVKMSPIFKSFKAVRVEHDRFFGTILPVQGVCCKRALMFGVNN